MVERTNWLGNVPTHCDIGKEEIKGVFIDGKTHMGPWGCMCEPCHKEFGIGLGMGMGQKYVQQENGQWLKVEG